MSQSRCPGRARVAATVTAGLMLAAPIAGWAQLDEITVTTRKKIENIQDVPIAVDAISAEQIERRGISSVADIVKLSTSVQFDQSFGPQDTRIAVRGLSNTRGRSNVAFLVDGVDITTENFVSAGSGLLANQRLLTDLERVEVVKGPQSALYGRAAFAGAISYTTKEPGPEFESKVRVEAGDFGKFQVDGAIGGPVVGLEEVLGLRLNGAVWRRDGYYTNATSGQDMGDESGWGTSVTAVFTPTDNFKIKLRTEFSDSQTGHRANVRLGGGGKGRTGADGFDGMIFFPYPIDPEFIQGPSNTTTRLKDFGEYCPEGVPDQGSSFGGICSPANFGTGSGLQPAVDVDPVTGNDYQGTETELLRTTLNATLDFDFGTFSSITGGTTFEAFNELDQDYQANPAGMFDWKGGQQSRSDLETKQFSQELRFSSSFDGPVNFTVGGLYWQEKRAQQDFDFIIACLEYGKAGPGNVFPNPAAFVPGICDGTNGTISSYQERALDIFPCEYDAQGNPIPDPTGMDNCLKAPRTATPWRSTTEHWSAYFNVAWNITDTFELLLESRLVDESFELLRPNFSSCTNLFFAFGTGTSVRANGDKEGPVTTAADDIVCTNERRLNPNIPETVNATNGDWMLVEGTEKSSFNTPKVTLNWKPTDTSTYYFSWGKGIKPGGINTLAAGGSPTTIDDERFLPEEVQAWELGAKTDWEIAGFLRLNGALFLNDYTDKQIGTQVVDDQGVLQPRVVNAAAAEVWGLEVEATWQPAFLEGLVLAANYTYLDAKYVDFIDLTRSLVRASYSQRGCPVVAFDDAGNLVDPNTVAAGRRFCAIDQSGKRLERTPQNAFVGNVQYTAPFMASTLDWFVEATASYQDKRFLDVDNAPFFDEYWTVDTRIGLTGETFEFLVYVDNLFEDQTIKTGGSGPDFAEQVTALGFTAGLGASHFFGTLPDPRVFGARLTMRF